MRKKRCLLNPSHKATVQHHIVPRSVGGSDNEDNLAWLCNECHAKVHREGTKKYREILRTKNESIK